MIAGVGLNGQKIFQTTNYCSFFLSFFLSYFLSFFLSSFFLLGEQLFHFENKNKMIYVEQEFEEAKNQNQKNQKFIYLNHIVLYKINIST